MQRESYLLKKKNYNCSYHVSKIRPYDNAMCLKSKNTTLTCYMLDTCDVVTCQVSRLTTPTNLTMLVSELHVLIKILSNSEGPT